MGLNCTTADNHPPLPLALLSEPHLVKKLNRKRNKRSPPGELNVTQDQMGQMETVLRAYDCHFAHLLHHPDLTILYNHQFELNMRQCLSVAKEATSGITIDSHRHVVKALRNVLGVLEDSPTTT